MSKSTKGRMPVSVRGAVDASDFTQDEFDFNVLKIDRELQAELAEQGLVYRWLNATQFKASGGYNKSGWKAYRKTADATRGAQDFTFGVSPEGYIIRNDLILAVKPKELQERWRKHVAQRAALMDASDDHIRQFREQARESGAKVFEGYEENE